MSCKIFSQKRFGCSELFNRQEDAIFWGVGAACVSLAKMVRSLVESRGGLAQLVGLAVVPSQFLCPKAEEANPIIAEAVRNQEKNGVKIERFHLPVQDGDTSVEGLIYYPKGCDPSDRSRCVVFHNPNGATLSMYVDEGQFVGTPAQIAELAHCPVILYDYRGTGLSSENRSLGFFSFRPTCESVVADGETVLEYALQKFQSVQQFGSSLGGGIATVSLDRHLAEHPADTERVSLVNHDSFSTTARVALPTLGRLADWIAWVLGGLLDAETAMKRLIERKIPITVLCHQDDPIIPKEARMAEFIAALPRKEHISVMRSPEYGHAGLSQDMLLHLTI